MSLAVAAPRLGHQYLQDSCPSPFQREMQPENPREGTDASVRICYCCVNCQGIGDVKTAQQIVSQSQAEYFGARRLVDLLLLRCFLVPLLQSGISYACWKRHPRGRNNLRVKFPVIAQNWAMIFFCVSVFQDFPQGQGLGGCVFPRRYL